MIKNMTRENDDMRSQSDRVLSEKKPTATARATRKKEKGWKFHAETNSPCTRARQESTPSPGLSRFSGASQPLTENLPRIGMPVDQQCPEAQG